jgi:hypothetical protein
MIRSIAEIGAMWPLCANCKHIAQAHDKDGCSELGIHQCPTCNQWATNMKCDCSFYNGPTWEEFKTRLTPEEIRYYHYDEKGISRTEQVRTEQS